MNKDLKKAMEKLMELRTTFCNNCGCVRIEVTEEQSPKEVKWLKTILGEDSKILYCEQCNTFGVVGSTESTF